MKAMPIGLLFVLAACGEHRQAARAVDCADTMQNVSTLTKAELRELREAERINAEGRGGREVAIGILWVLELMAGGHPQPRSTDLVPTPQVGWPHVWVGCGEVALCHPDETCARADWLKPSALAGLMARSEASPYDMLGIAECGEPPHASKTGPTTWNLDVCGVTSRCWVLTDPRQFDCLRGDSPPAGVSPVKP